MRRFRPRLLALMMIAAAASIVANAVGAVTAATEPPTRLGVSIEKDIGAQARAAADRNRALDMREQAARATEARIKADLADKAAEATSGGGADAAKAGAEFDSLARVYQAMKPARAAPVFEQLTMDVQMQVAKRMRDRSMGLILAAMTTRGAAALSMSLAGKPVPTRPADPPAGPAATTGATAPVAGSAPQASTAPPAAAGAPATARH